MHTNPSSKSVLVIADPGATETIGERLSEALAAGRESADGWEVSTRRQAYPIEEHTDFVDVVGTLDPDNVSEDIVLYLTDLPPPLRDDPAYCRDSSFEAPCGDLDSGGDGGATYVERRTRRLVR